MTFPTLRPPVPSSRQAALPGARQTMARLHGWTGLIPGWLVFVIFLFGTLAFFQQEISSWMRPEIGPAALSQQTIDKASDILQSESADASAWSLSFPTARGGEPVMLSWRLNDTGPEMRRDLDPATGRPVVVRETFGGAFLFAFHYNLHYMPAWLAEYIVCIAALAMLLSIVSGVITHKRIFKDYFTLRLNKGQRSWLDAHNAMAVLALPFQLMITYTGLVTLIFLIMPWGVITGYSDTEAFRRDFRPRAPSAQFHQKDALRLSAAELVAAARRVDGAMPRSLNTHEDYASNGAIEVWPNLEKLGASYETRFLQSDGEVIPPATGPGAATNSMGVMVDLHAGRFSGYVLRWLYFVSGLAGTAMIATGLILWVRKRRESAGLRPSATGLWIAERLNVGIIAGSLAGIGAFFLANRLLPVPLPGRAEKEVACLFFAWAAVILWSLLREPKQGWIVSLAFGALLFALVPLVSAVTTARGLIPSLAAGDWVFVSFDLSMVAAAAALALTAVRLHRRAEPKKRVSR